jgi:inhibitor of cysteine peptidase
MCKKIFLGLAFVFFSTAIFAANGVNYIDPLKTIVVKKSAPEFTITIQSNPTTGYSWSLKDYDYNLISPVSSKYYPPVNKKLIGAGGYEKWTFRVKPQGFIVPQTTSLTLIYSRPWDQQGAQVTIFKVVTVNGD